MQGTKRGEDAAGRAARMEAIVARHETPLLRYASRITNNPFIAEDVVQNVFIKLFRAWKPGLRPSAGLKSWLYRVTHNEAVDFIRRESRLQKLYRGHAEEKKDDCPDGRNCPGKDERKALVLEHLKALLPREQQVLLLRLEHGMSYREISEVTGRSEGNVGNILHHAVRKMAEKVQGAEGTAKGAK
ncbi:MAG: sigma-70 family RNA polymerase sigma factor [Kiritimatiellia bacterium]